MESIFLILTVGALNVACFFIGAKVGQTVTKGEMIEAPAVHPFKAYREHQEQRAANAEADKLDAIMHNINSYGGTSAGQRDIPQ